MSFDAKAFSGAALDAGVLAALEAALRARTKWDESPGLYFLKHQDGCVEVSDRELFDRWPPHPPDALPLIAEAMEDTGFLAAAFTAPHNFIGMAFRCESWAVFTPGPEIPPGVRKMMEARKLHTHPDRVECRVIWAVTRSGRHYFASQKRGSDQIEKGATENREGTIPESLDRMVRALLTGNASK